MTGSDSLVLPQPAKVWPWLALAGGLLITASAFAPGLYAIDLAALSVLAVAILCGRALEGLLAAFMVSSALIHLLKKVIFLFGPQPQALYYGIQAVPAVLLLLLLAAAVRRHSTAPPPASAYLLLAYLIAASGATLASLKSSSLTAVGGALYQQILPMLLFFVSITLSAGHIRRALAALCLLGAGSTFYGLVHVLGGPTPIERAWAEAVYAYSIQGGKVLAYMEGLNSEFRGFSFYADPLTWGLFLLSALAAAALARQMAVISKAQWRLCLWLTLVGLFTTMTRTCWIGLGVMVLVYAAMKRRELRRPWPLFFFTISLFLVTVLGGSYLYQEYFLTRKIPVFENPFLKRYATIGTVEARMTALEEMKSALADATLFGRGNSVLTGIKERPASEYGVGTGLIHNVAVQLVVQNGIVGFTLYVLFFAQWLREATRKARGARSLAEARCYAWVIAYAVASVVTGYWNGNCYMTYYHWFLLGLAASRAFAGAEGARAENGARFALPARGI